MDALRMFHSAEASRIGQEGHRVYAGGSAPACSKMWSNRVVLSIPSTANSHLSALSYGPWSAGNRLQRGMGSREHMHHIRGTGGIGKQHLLQLFCTNAIAHGHGKDVNHLFGMRTEEMRAQDALASLFD
jgi:hypothetical protein